MAWACLQEELAVEFADLSCSPDATVERAIMRAKGGGGTSGFRLILPRHQDRRRDGLARVLDCKECGARITRPAHAKFCSVACKNRYHQRKWYKAHPQHQCRKKERKPLCPVATHCKQCGARLPPPRTARENGRIYCNEKCRLKFYYRKSDKEKNRERQRRYVERNRDLINQKRRAA